MKIFIFFVLISSSHQQSCISYDYSFNISSYSLNRSELNKTFESVESSICSIMIELDYINQLLKMMFNRNGSIDKALLTRASSTLKTTFTLDLNSSSIISVLFYNCSTKDFCNQHFLFNHLFLLLEQNYNQLQLMFIKLLIKERNRPVVCIDKPSKRNLLNCTSGVCNTNMPYSKNMSYDYSGGCGNHRKYSTIVRIITIPYYQDYSLRHDLFYTCMFHGCNNRTMASKILDILQTSYDVRKIFYQQNITSNITSTSTTSVNLQTTIIDTTTISYIEEIRSTTLITDDTTGEQTGNSSTIIKITFVYFIYFISIFHLII